MVNADEKNHNSVINKKAVRALALKLSPHMTQIEKGYFVVLEHKVRQMIIASVKNNTSRKRLTQFELV